MLANPPSIPSHNNIFGYEENQRGELIRQKDTETKHTGYLDDHVGPGEYDVSMKKSTKGQTKWVKSELAEKVIGIMEKRRVNVPGPGHYKPPLSSVNPVYKNNKSSVFASGVPRTA